jgi:hypothetical protein
MKTVSPRDTISGGPKDRSPRILLGCEATAIVCRSRNTWKTYDSLEFDLSSRYEISLQSNGNV